MLDDDLAKIALGSYMLELTDALTTEESEAAEAYRVLSEGLGALSTRFADCGAAAGVRAAAARMGRLRTRVHALPHLRDP